VLAELIELSGGYCLRRKWKSAANSGKPRPVFLYGNVGTQLQSGQADVAQLVEQSIRNRQVIGSSPIVGSSLFNSLPTISSKSAAQLLHTQAFFQLFHRAAGVFSRRLDVEALRSAHAFMAQNRLYRSVRHPELFQIRCQSPTVSVPTLPFEIVGLQNRLDHSIREIFEIECSTETVLEHKPVGMFWPNAF
jgi:hypothetical protein